MTEKTLRKPMTPAERAETMRVTLDSETARLVKEVGSHLGNELVVRNFLTREVNAFLRANIVSLVLETKRQELQTLENALSAGAGSTERK